MVTKLLQEINENIKKLNHLLEDEDYLNNLQKQIDEINKRIGIKGEDK